jgi:hypothetical protein
MWYPLRPSQRAVLLERRSSVLNVDLNYWDTSKQSPSHRYGKFHARLVNPMVAPPQSLVVRLETAALRSLVGIRTKIGNPSSVLCGWIDTTPYGRTSI